MENELKIAELMKKLPLKFGDPLHIRIRDKFESVMKLRKFAAAATKRERAMKKLVEARTGKEKELMESEKALISLLEQAIHISTDLSPKMNID